jgi:hypothetical protein
MLAVFIAWLPLVAKLLLTAAIVVTASITTERAGPLVGALVVTLPVTVWPAYLFLSLDHDAAFVAESAVGGLAMNAVNGVFMLVYVVLAQKRGLVLSLAAAIVVWVALAMLARLIVWNEAGAIALSLVVYPACVWLVRPYCDVAMPLALRRWYDIPVRTLLVCALMATVLAFSQWGGAVVTGFIAVFPISTTSAILILQPRIGGRATAAMVANGILGMAGIGVGLAALYLAIGPLGAVFALALALAIPVGWNLSAWTIRARLKQA